MTLLQIYQDFVLYPYKKYNDIFLNMELYCLIET